MCFLPPFLRLLLVLPYSEPYPYLDNPMSPHPYHTLPVWTSSTPTGLNKSIQYPYHTMGYSVPLPLSEVPEVPFTVLRGRGRAAS